MRAKALKDRIVDGAAGRSLRWAISVWCTVRRDGEDVIEAGQRLASELLDNAAAPNGDRISIVTGATLRVEDLSLALDEPPLGHYVVGTGNMTTEPDFTVLARVFATRHKNPAFQKGLES